MYVCTAKTSKFEYSLMKTTSLWNHATNYGNQQLFTQLFVFNEGNHNHFWSLEVVKIKRLFQMVMSK